MLTQAACNSCILKVTAYYLEVCSEFIMYVEADAATFDKKVEKGKLHWEHWCGIVQLDCNWFSGQMVHGRVLAGHGSGANEMGKLLFLF